MKCAATILLFMALASATPSSALPNPDSDTTIMQHVAIKEITVTAEKRRTLASIGLQTTAIDTLALHNDITSSLADVLMNTTSVFIKSYGRASLSTASFRGTAPSHTQVTWNGMPINSPMLGMVDFSMIPSYFVDGANLLHGASSIGVSGGAIGGAVLLSTKPEKQHGFGLEYIQGIGSFSTYDEYLRFTYGNEKLQLSTRISYSSSNNDFKYTNYDKKQYFYDDAGNITGYEYPVMRNRNGSFADLNIMQEFYYLTSGGSRIGAGVWYINSDRGVPMLNVNSHKDDKSENRQYEQTLRAYAGWDKTYGDIKLGARGGYSYSDLLYLYKGDNRTGELVEMIHSQGYVHTAYAEASADWFVLHNFKIKADLSARQHNVSSNDLNSGGYRAGRFEMSGLISAKWRPTERFGLGIDIREELYGEKFTPIIPAGFIDYTISKRGNVVAKASIASNYRYPSLNDLYFIPGGNQSLEPEHGFTYDGGIEFSIRKPGFSISGEVSAYDSHIDNWIMWIPSEFGYWTPLNIRRVHSYGVEAKADFGYNLSKTWRLDITGNFAWTPSINDGDPMNWADESIGKQLVYIPEYSASVNGRLTWRQWTFVYKWCYYGKRYTTSSNETKTKLNVVGAYFMSDISLEKIFSLKWADLSAKIAVNNLLNEDYVSVLSRPMPRLNCTFFIGIKPHFRNQGRK